MIELSSGTIGDQSQFEAETERKKKEQEDILAGNAYRMNDDFLNIISGSNLGEDRAKKQLYDATMEEIAAKKRDLAKGYDGQTLGALRNTARGELAGQQASYLGQLRSKAAKSGVGGARGLASEAGAQQKFNENTANAENKMMVQNTDLMRKGEADVADYEMKRKYGVLASGFGYGQMASGQNAAQKAAAAGNGGGGGMCCFIFLESRYGNGTMDKVVRRFRDENMTEKNRRGYYKLSEVLVPLMRKHKSIKFAVSMLMTTPMVIYGKSFYGETSFIGKIFKPVVNFWLGTFDYLGGEHTFIRENGETI